MAKISSNLQMTLPESFDKVDVDILSDNFQKIDDFAGEAITKEKVANNLTTCLLYTSPSPRDRQKSRMPSSA